MFMMKDTINYVSSFAGGIRGGSRIFKKVGILRSASKQVRGGGQDGVQLCAQC